jgi:Xaa-Pro dipeptidase
MTRLEEIREKEARLRGLMKTKGLAAVLLKRQANFSWLTAGGINLIGIATEMGGTSILVTEAAKYVLTTNVEAPRMIEEEGVETLGFQVKTFNWWDDQEAAIVKDLAGGGPVGCDVPFPDAPPSRS